MRVAVDIAPNLQPRRDVQRIVADVKDYLAGLQGRPTLGPEFGATAELRVYENSFGVPVFVAELHDGDRSRAEVYYPDQLTDPSVIHLRLGELWRSLLRDKSRDQLGRIRETVSQMAEDE